MSIYIVLIYFLGISIGFLQVPGPLFFARALGRKKPLPAADSCAVPSAAAGLYRLAIYFPAGQLRATCRLPGPRTMQLIKVNIFINTFLPHSSRGRASVNGVIGIDSSDRGGPLCRGQTSALVCYFIVYGMGCLPKAFLRVVWCWMRSSTICYV